jgi:hypothetical protein
MPRISKLFDQYASARGIAKREIDELKDSVLADEHVDAGELKELRRARTEHASDFTSAGRREMDRFLGQWEIQGGKSVRAYEEFDKVWKVDRDVDYRERWGIDSMDDPRAPTFQREVPMAGVAASARSRFLNFAQAQLGELHGDPMAFLTGDCGAAQITNAWKIYDREHRLAGFALRAADDSGHWVTSYYRSDGEPVGFQTSGHEE